ncbi:MAG: chorismate mutase [Clostridia bacterium]|nr:chorismate mutase [Clostridia bacterium]
MNIEELRNKIDIIDTELVKLFQERMKTASQIADYKKENGLPVFDAERERKVIGKVTSNVSEEIVPYAETLYNTIFDLSRSYQKKRMSR